MKKNLNKVLFMLIGIIIGIAISAGAATIISGNYITYDNTGSNLTSTNVQNALDELSEKTSKMKYTPLDDEYYYLIGSKTTNELLENDWSSNTSFVFGGYQPSGYFYHTSEDMIDITNFNTLEMKYSLYNHQGYTTPSVAKVVLKKIKPTNATEAGTVAEDDILVLSTNMDSTIHDLSFDISDKTGKYYLVYYLYHNYSGFYSTITTHYLRMK